MNELMGARGLSGRPVVTLGGDAVGQIKDTVFDGAAGQVSGFTLSGRGLLAGPLRESLPWAAVHALGRDAVMIRDREALAERSVVVARGEASHGGVLGARVLTDEGAEIGVVLDVVVEAGTSGRVAGFRIQARRSLVPGSRRRRRDVFVPRGEALAVSGRALVVPADAVRFVADDLTGFAARVAAFRARGADEKAAPEPAAPDPLDGAAPGRGTRKEPLS
ncbi:PRC-barrel domain-containing protein [Streptomyces sp. NPDC048664]|uniref:PRC-barrel domain-containing protein n=1 Tax=Streptomyces sp. NPDC048664 TaxID=3154505 RepID=UPI0034303312